MEKCWLLAGQKTALFKLISSLKTLLREESYRRLDFSALVSNIRSQHVTEEGHKIECFENLAAVGSEISTKVARLLCTAFSCLGSVPT